MTLVEFNTVDASGALAVLQQCNASARWCEKMVINRPFENLTALKAAAEMHWRAIESADYLQAFEAHPMIGDVNSLRAKYAATKSMATGEQSGASGADEAILTELSELNHAYLKKFGFIFIVFATGKSASEMLALLKARIENTRPQEIENAAAEQLKITLLRIDKLFGAA